MLGRSGGCGEDRQLASSGLAEIGEFAGHPSADVEGLFERDL
jgi:hypothetical protein